MWYNHGKAENRFHKEWAEKLKTYRQYGMTDMQIQALYDLEREIFNSDRRFYEHCEPEYEILPQMSQQIEMESYDASNWTTVLPQEIQQRLQQLPAERLRAFYYYRVLHYTQQEIAAILSNSQSTVHRWIRQIAEILDFPFHDE